MRHLAEITRRPRCRDRSFGQRRSTSASKLRALRCTACSSRRSAAGRGSRRPTGARRRAVTTPSDSRIARSAGSHPTTRRHRPGRSRSCARSAGAACSSTRARAFPPDHSPLRRHRAGRPCSPRRCRRSRAARPFGRSHLVAPTLVHHDGRVGLTRDLDLDLSDADRLDDHPLLADRVEHAHGLRSRERRPPRCRAKPWTG